MQGRERPHLPWVSPPVDPPAAVEFFLEAWASKRSRRNRFWLTSFTGTSPPLSVHAARAFESSSCSFKRDANAETHLVNVQCPCFQDQRAGDL